MTTNDGINYADSATTAAAAASEANEAHEANCQRQQNESERNKKAAGRRRDALQKINKRLLHKDINGRIFKAYLYLKNKLKI